MDTVRHVLDFLRQVLGLGQLEQQPHGFVGDLLPAVVQVHAMLLFLSEARGQLFATVGVLHKVP